MLIHLPWHKLSPDGFELLCYELLGRMGFRDLEWFRGPSDRGRDIVGRFVERRGGRRQTAYAAFECKRFTRRSVAVEDVQRSILWFVARAEYRKLVIVTSSHLRTDTREWIAAMQLSHPRKQIEYLEGHVLFQHLLQHRDILERFFPGAAVPSRNIERSLAEYHSSLSTIWRNSTSPSATRLRESQRAYRQLRRALGRIDDPMVGLVFLDQHQRVNYTMKGKSELTLRSTCLNIGHLPISEDDFLVTSLLPIDFLLVSRSSVTLAVAQQSLVRRRLTTRFTGPQSVVFQYSYPCPVAPLTSCTARLRTAIVYRRPFKRQRRWTAISYRFTARLTIEVVVPDGYTFDQAVVITERGYQRSLAEAPVVEANRAFARRSCVGVGEGTTIEFIPRRDVNNGDTRL